MFRRCFSGFTKDKVTILYKSLIRPILEYASTAWCPWFVKDISRLQKVQDRCLNLCAESVNLEPLIERRHRGDLIDTYKYLNNMYRTDPTNLFVKPTKQLRGHSLKLQKQRVRTDVAKYFFKNRIVDSWNQLDEELVTAPNIKTFKDRILKRSRSLPLG
jgi:hypothetical protein